MEKETATDNDLGQAKKEMRVFESELDLLRTARSSQTCQNSNFSPVVNNLNT